jgi:FkbM family methyltransferase
MAEAVMKMTGKTTFNRKANTMSLQQFPSPLTQTLLKGQKHNFAVTLPRNERFRVKNIFVDREYEINRQFLPRTPITVVDIGANVGLFSLYMAMTQSLASIHCFEPAPASLELLRHNTVGLENIHIHPYGLTDRNGRALLSLHPRNTGENKIITAPADSDRTIQVQVRDAAQAFDHLGLTYIDVLKIDTEGCEIPILKSLVPRLDYIGIILLEYHSKTDRRRIDQFLSRFALFGAKVGGVDVGTLKYVNQRLLEEDRAQETLMPTDDYNYPAVYSENEPYGAHFYPIRSSNSHGEGGVPAEAIFFDYYRKHGRVIKDGDAEEYFRIN